MIHTSPTVRRCTLPSGHETNCCVLPKLNRTLLGTCTASRSSPSLVPTVAAKLLYPSSVRRSNSGQVLVKQGEVIYCAKVRRASMAVLVGAVSNASQTPRFWDCLWKAADASCLIVLPSYTQESTVSIIYRSHEDSRSASPLPHNQ